MGEGTNVSYGLNQRVLGSTITYEEEINNYGAQNLSYLATYNRLEYEWGSDCETL